MSTTRRINPAMQPDITPDTRPFQDAQLFPAYGWGACPLCGAAGDHGDEGMIDDDTDWHQFDCPACGISYTYQTRFVYRFQGIDEEHDA